MARWRIDPRALALGLIAVVIGVLALISRQGEETDPAVGPAPPPVQSIERAPASTGLNPKPRSEPNNSWLDGDWEIFAYTDGELVRIDLRANRVVRTQVNGLPEGPPASLIVGPDQVLVRSWESGVILVADDRTARRLPGPVYRAGGVLPGPRDTQLWLERWRPGEGLELIATTWGGRPVAPPVRLSAQFQLPQPDHRGGVIVRGTGGTYLVDTSGPRRITRGEVIGVGPNHLVTTTCDDQARCRHHVVDRNSGDARRLETDLDGAGQPGVISGDGRYLAIGSASAELRVIDLRTGGEIELTSSADIAVSGPAQQLAWSPNGRWLLVADASTVRVIDPRTGVVRPLGVHIPGAETVAVRE